MDRDVRRGLTLAAGAAGIAVVAVVVIGGVVLAIRSDTSRHQPGGGGAAAELKPTEGSTARGRVVFFEAATRGVRVVAHVEGLAPGEHGFHIHENGDCSAPDASSAGGHFDPTGMPHAGPEAERRHAGDLGNLTADESGMAHLERVDTHLSLEGGGSIVGRAVVVHAGRDDLTSQPAGDAGGRLACGVIGPDGDRAGARPEP